MSIFRKNIEDSVTAIAAGINTFNEIKKDKSVSSASLSVALFLLAAGRYIENVEGKYALTVRGHGLYALIKDHNERTGDEVAS